MVRRVPGFGTWLHGRVDDDLPLTACASTPRTVFLSFVMHPTGGVDITGEELFDLAADTDSTKQIVVQCKQPRGYQT